MSAQKLWSFADKYKSWHLWSRKCKTGILWQATHGKPPVTEEGYTYAEVIDQVDYNEAMSNG